MTDIENEEASQKARLDLLILLERGEHPDPEINAQILRAAQQAISREGSLKRISEKARFLRETGRQIEEDQEIILEDRRQPEKALV